MLKKKRIFQLIKNVRNLIASDAFKEKHCLEKNAFTRDGKPSFQDIIYFPFGLPKKPLPAEPGLFFEGKNMTVSKQAFSKAGYKISPGAFEDIFGMSADISQFTARKRGTDAACLQLTVLRSPLAIIKTTRRNSA